MPRKKKASELTTEEVMKRCFPAKAVREAKKVAHEKDATDNGKKQRKKQGKKK